MRSNTTRYGVRQAQRSSLRNFADLAVVLTLPAFRCIQVDASHNCARVGHTCHIVGRSQLLSIGGVDAAQSDPWSTVDTAFQGLGTFDLDGWKWTQGYNASAAPYKRADATESFYKKNEYILLTLSQGVDD